MLSRADMARGHEVVAAAAWGGRDGEEPTRGHSFRLPPAIHTSLRRASLELMRKNQQRTVSHLVGLALERYLDDLRYRARFGRSSGPHELTHARPVGPVAEGADLKNGNSKVQVVACASR